MKAVIPSEFYGGVNERVPATRLTRHGGKDGGVGSPAAYGQKGFHRRVLLLDGSGECGKLS